jgi:hypothetical protein
VMPTKAMMSVLGSNVSASTNMTVNPTKKGTEFLFPAFSELFYAPTISWSWLYTGIYVSECDGIFFDGHCWSTRPPAPGDPVL